MLSENIYALRRKSGLSQEQLAERIGVSRQAVSKWESGASTPELEKLRLLCQCFQISMDALTGDSVNSPTPDPILDQEKQQEQGKASVKSKGGLLLCLLGAIGLGVAGLLMMFCPDVAEQLNESSVVTLNGSGIFLLVSALCLCLGVYLILSKNRKNRK